LDNGRACWFDLDLPDVIALRRRFFDDTARVRMFEGSVLDIDWFDVVGRLPGPYLFVSEAVLLYLVEGQVQEVLRNLVDRFPGMTMLFDTGGRDMMNNQDMNPVFQAIPARMRWVCDHPADLERWGLRWVESRTLAQPQPRIARTWPRRYRAGLPLLARIAPAIVNTYKLNRFELR